MGLLMPEKTVDLYGTADSEEDFLRLCRERYARAIDADRENREQALDDLQFRVGEQWPDDIRKSREDEGRPVLTVNRTSQFVRQVTGDIRINKPGIKVRPVDDGADPEVAEIFSGIIRHIEQASRARIAYTTAADSSATCGIGHFRIVTEYSDDDVFDQDIRIRRMPNPFSVVWDEASVELCREDARWCLVTDLMPKDAFEADYPEASLSAFESAEGLDYLKDWWDDDEVRVAEYWLKVPAVKTIVRLEDGRVMDEADVPDGSVITKSRTVDCHKVVQYIVSGAEILEGPTEWPGKHIPIIPVVGEEVAVGERTVRHGVIRFAKDPQRLYNYWRSATAEAIALSPKAPFIVEEKQVKGLEAQWREANRANLPYLKYKATPEAPPPQRQLPPQISSAMVSETVAAADDMNAVTGIYPAALGQRSNETSGVAIQARQREGDVGTFVYVDNLAHSIAFAGEQLVDLIPKIYDGERVIRILGEDDTEDFVRLNVPSPEMDGAYGILKEGPGGVPMFLPPLDVGKYDVAVTTGPSYSTKRMEAADSIMQFLQAAPQTAGLVIDLLAKNLDWPGSDEIAKRLAKTIPPEIRDDLPPQPPQPSPEQMAEAAKAQADVAKAQADIQKTEVEIEGKRLDNAEKQLELAQQMGAMQELVKRTVQDTLMQVLGQQPSPAEPWPPSPVEPYEMPR